MLSGDASEKTRKTYQGLVDQINALEPGLQALSDDQLRAKTEDFRARYKAGETLDDLLVEAFAVRPAAACLGHALPKAFAMNYLEQPPSTAQNNCPCRPCNA